MSFFLLLFNPPVIFFLGFFSNLKSLCSSSVFLPSPHSSASHHLRRRSRQSMEMSSLAAAVEEKGAPLTSPTRKKMKTCS